MCSITTPNNYINITNSLKKKRRKVYTYMGNKFFDFSINRLSSMINTKLLARGSEWPWESRPTKIQSRRDNPTGALVVLYKVFQWIKYCKSIRDRLIMVRCSIIITGSNLVPLVSLRSNIGISRNFTACCDVTAHFYSYGTTFTF